ncbi:MULTISPECIES: aminoacyl-tRNA deacylase [unclassified Thiocapsa]|uniref:aminoacyl-tRNA deacylase n=1 Tax=unclassified Thiocapsa TaxID=2641286 RepID=UPI0035B133C8
MPATYRLELGRLNQVIARHLEMIDETEMESTFSDCERGAIPAIGAAYGIETVLETDMARQQEIYFESGDHEHLIKMRGEDFCFLLNQAPRIHVSHHLQRRQPGAAASLLRAPLC